MAGVVVEIGGEVTKHRVGDKVGVGTMVNSCGTCDPCVAGHEQYCANGNVQAYGSVDRDRTVTQGGYSTHVVVVEDFVLQIPDGIPFEAAAPLLCAGITTFSPLRHWNAGPGRRVAIAGMGGLGHMGVKLAHAMGAHVTMITTTPEKGEDARKLGAHDVIVSTDKEAMKAAATRFDFILNTIPVSHEIDPYLNLLGRSGRMVIVGALTPMPGFVGMSLIWWNRAVGGSAIGGIPETQEMLDFCAEKDIYPDCEFIAMNEVNEAYERLLKNDVRYRFVIDMSRGL
jgi:uncharacterized zinc-type alcohol dehydrogenase-like protein